MSGGMKGLCTGEGPQPGSLGVGRIQATGGILKCLPVSSQVSSGYLQHVGVAQHWRQRDGDT